MEFCDKFNCTDCCFEAKVPLLNEDIDRIIMHGYYDAYFVVEHEGIKTMRTWSDGSCIFFDKSSGQCEIYESRPERCRLNPYTISQETLKPTIDRACKHCNNCSCDEVMQKRMSEYLVTLEREIEWRRKNGYYL